jgi:hypothetical protein
LDYLFLILKTMNIFKWVDKILHLVSQSPRSRVTYPKSRIRFCASVGISESLVYLSHIA